MRRGDPSRLPRRKQSRDAQAPPEGANIPDYEVTAPARECQIGSPGTATCVSATSDATSSKDLELVTRDLRQEHPDASALAVTFYPPIQTSDQSGTGFAFSDQASAIGAISAMYPEGSSAVDGEVDKAMRNDGVYVVAVTETVDDMIVEQCQTWDYEALGEPPAEWNCEQYR